MCTAGAFREIVLWMHRVALENSLTEQQLHLIQTYATRYMRVLGIDPAPSKSSTICDPGGSSNDLFDSLQPTELADAVETLNSEQGPVLICWDAPLTGPPLNGERSSEAGNAYSQRPIDAFFGKSESTHDWGTYGVSGISVQPYSGCPHWTITRALFGYPRLGRYCKPPSELPWKLQTNPVYSPSSSGKDIVEVHPALALWLMLPRDKRHSEKENFKYKGNSNEDTKNEAKQTLFDGLAAFTEGTEAHDVVKSQQAEALNDDELDALTAWVLGTLWTEMSERVRLLGNQTYGTFLLPTDTEMENEFYDYVQ